MSFSYHKDSGGIAPRTIDGAGFGKVAIITGCASGIGLATTNLFLSHQYQVVGVDLNPIDYAKVENEVQEGFHFHQGDLAEEGQCEEVVRICVAKYGPKIHVLANVAGIMDGFGSAETFTDKEWNRVIAVNLTVPTKMMRAVLPNMKEHGGSIVNVCSKAAVSGAVAGIAYTASKHGLLGATKQTAYQFRNKGIRCNAVLPGGVMTNIGASMDVSALDQTAFAESGPVHALHTIDGQAPIPPLDVANAIFFLAGDGAKHINGAALPVDKAWGTL